MKNIFYQQILQIVQILFTEIKNLYNLLTKTTQSADKTAPFPTGEKPFKTAFFSGYLD
jgi:hypothetical protein